MTITTSVVEFLFDLPTEFSGSNQTPIHPSVGISLAESKPLLGVQIVQSDDGKKAWLGQPTIIKSLEKQFGEKVAKKKMTITPGTPGFIGGKVGDISKVDEKTQSMNRSGVGTLLYLTKHSTPDIKSLLRELSKSMDGASMAHVTEMYRVINFVLEMKRLGLGMVPIFKDGIWKLEALSDSDFANDKDTRYSVYGYIIYFCGIPVAWKSKCMINN